MTRYWTDVNRHVVPVQQNPLFLLSAPTDLSAQRTENAFSAGLKRRSRAFHHFGEYAGTPTELHTRIDHNSAKTHNGQLLYQLGRLRNLRQFGGGDRLAQAPGRKDTEHRRSCWLDNYVFRAAVARRVSNFHA